LDVLGASLERVLVIDASCACNGDNGVGNLFGDYAVWLTLAALAERAIFIAWASRGTADDPNRSHACPCERARRRFDLGELFQSASGRAWRWTAATQKAVVKRHGSSAEAVYEVARARPCEELSMRLAGPEPWLTVRDPFASSKNRSARSTVAMMPRCSGKDVFPGAKGAVVAPLIHAFALRWSRSKGSRSGSRGGPSRGERDLTQTLDDDEWSLWRTPLRPSTRSTPLGQLMRCVLHAMLRPRPALAAHLGPLAERVGSDALVVLQLRTGWADDTDVLARHSARRAKGEGGRAKGEGGRHLHRAASSSGFVASASDRWEALTSSPCGQLPPEGIDMAQCADPSGRKGRSQLPRVPGARVPRSNSSKLAAVVECSARRAHSIARERRGGSRDAWRVFVSSDSPGVRALLERLPALQGRFMGCVPTACSARTGMHSKGGSAAVGLGDRLDLAVDLWMLGAADASVFSTETSFSHWASRAPLSDVQPPLMPLASGLTKPAGLCLARQSCALHNRMLSVCLHPTAKGACLDDSNNYLQAHSKPRRGESIPARECFERRAQLLSSDAAAAVDA
jgi:hypothetical protein